MIGKKVVVRFMDGAVKKGYTCDFSPFKESFHLYGEASSAPAERICLKQGVKAVFFVRTFAGDPARRKNYLETATRGCARKVRLRFADGESMLGLTESYSHDRQGFMLVPTDPGGNNEKIFALSSAVQECLVAN